MVLVLLISWISLLDSEILQICGLLGIRMYGQTLLGGGRLDGTGMSVTR